MEACLVWFRAEQLLTPPVVLQLLGSSYRSSSQPKPKKGIQFLQEKGLLTIPMDNTESLWLRENLDWTRNDWRVCE